MPEEIKIRISDYKKVEEHLTNLGAKFVEEIDVVDTYFNQPGDDVLKITEDNKGNFLVQLIARNGKFEIVKYDKIKNVEQQKSELHEKFGISNPEYITVSFDKL